MEPGLRFRAGSVTKSLVATVVLRLVADGRLALPDTVERRLPGILPFGDRVTVRQLLNHTGGVPQYWATVEQALYGSREGRLRVWTPRELVALPGFLSVLLSTRDGRRQLSVMINVLPAPDPVYEAFIQGFRALGGWLLSERHP